MILTSADYVVTLSMLAIPLAIGIFFAWKDSKKANREEYLLGGRKMKILPVTFSIFVTFQSAISLIGFTGEIYRNGLMASGFYVGSSLACLVASFTVIPLLHQLQLMSIYEYLEMRYKSNALRMMATYIGMLDTFIYMVIAMLSPALALQAAAGIPFWMSVVVVGAIGTVYTAIGGIKSVIWTDAFQTFIIFGGLFLLIVKGTIAVGGSNDLWSIAREGGRTSMTEFSPDPRTRHSWWGITMGMCITWFVNVFSQANVQRISAMETSDEASKCSLLNIPFHLIYGAVIAVIGVLIYSYFYVIRCDPLEGGFISNVNQVSLYFMLHVFQDFPGLAGFYMATIFSGSLSTMSSGINALAANTLEDVLGRRLHGTSERKIIILAKILVFVYGFVIVGTTYFSKSLQGTVTQLSISAHGVCGSVVVGIFLIGCTVPWTNKYGVFAGGFISFIFNIWIAVGNRLYGRKIRSLESAPTDNCSSRLTGSSVLYDMGNSTSWSSVYNITSPIPSTSSGSTIDDPYHYGFFLYDISYEWYSVIGVIVCSITTLIVSKITSGRNETKTDAKLIIPILRRFWNLVNMPTTELDNRELVLT